LDGKKTIRRAAAALTLALLFALIPAPAPAFADDVPREDVTVTFDAGYKWPSGRNIHRDTGKYYLKTDVTIPYGEKLSGELPVKYRLGHIMTGWYTKKKGGKKISRNTAITEDVTYYAHWKKASAEQIAKSIAKRCKKEKSAEKRIQAATVAVTAFVAQNEYTSKKKNYNKPHGVFVAGHSTCAGETRALGMVIGYMGYTWTHANENKWTHQWVRVSTKKGVRWADANVIITSYDRSTSNTSITFNGRTGKGKTPPYV
jgi:uncharacterized repeat protein (TIGR02543 family)